MVTFNLHPPVHLLEAAINKIQVNEFYMRDWLLSKLCFFKIVSFLNIKFKMLYPIGPDGPVNQGYANLNEKVYTSQ